jgi:hypothetical protein
VPLLVISPWVKDGSLQNRGYASHVFYSHASFARFIEWAFNLPTLGAADDLSTYTAGEPKPGNLRDFFDFSGSPPKGKDILPVRVCPKLTQRATDAGCHRTRRLTSVHSASCRR